MSFDKDTRNALSKMVATCRRLLTEDVTDQLRGRFGMHPDGMLLSIDRLDLAEDEKLGAEALRELLEHFAAGEAGRGEERRQLAYNRLVLEISFTTLNRLAALRLCEERGLVVECVLKGTASDGFRIFERVSGGALGTRYQTYRVFLECLFDELALDLGVLFDRFTPQSSVFPGERCLTDVLAELNKEELAHLWAFDETIGWIYQYFNPPEERKAMRDASAAPRNSRELAVRNQFFTPRYVVEFLTDNTLGRIWYEMRKGETALQNECRYLVRRSNEIFLDPGEKVPISGVPVEDLSQEDLLRRPTHVEHRPKKDPRDLRVLDPACGSGHFLLYAFDLLERIYEEAWQDPESPTFEATGRTLRKDFETIEDLRQAVPKLVIKHNLHGIDIDPRAVQIAALALWLRAQKAWKSLDIKATERPRIERSNIATAEPMPGEEDLRLEFIAGLKPRVLGQLVNAVFEKMKLAGEAGSLLKIEEEIKDAVAAAKVQFVAEQRRLLDEAGYLPSMAPPREATLFDFTDLSEEKFWEQAEDLILRALKSYAEDAENGRAVRRHLFADDSARGFAYIDLCRQHYDVVLMNPPFGQSSSAALPLTKSTFGIAAFDLFACFLERGIGLLRPTGAIGAITTSAGFYRNQVENWRASFFLDGSLRCCADLGGHVLDGATVRTAIYVRDSAPSVDNSVFIRCNESNEKETFLWRSIEQLRIGASGARTFLVDTRRLNQLPGRPLAYWLPQHFQREMTRLRRFADTGGDAQFGLSTKDDFRFLRLAWEIPPRSIGQEEPWCFTSKGGEFSPFYFDIHLLVLHESGFRVLEQAILLKYPYLGDNASWVLHLENSYYRPGITFQRRTNKPFAPRALPAGCLFTDNGPSAFWDAYSLPAFLGLFNSSAIRLLAAVGNGALEAEGGGGANSYEVGIIKNLVVPPIPAGAVDEIASRTLEAVRLKRQRDRHEPETRAFVCPVVSSIPAYLESEASAEIEVCNLAGEIDELVSPLYGFSRTELEQLMASVSPDSSEDDEGAEQSGQDDGRYVVHNRLSAITGYCVGRWDVRIALDPSLAPVLPDPFDRLPVCPPATLVGPDGLPGGAERIVSEEWLRARPDANTLPREGSVKDPTVSEKSYPLRVSWDGILVDDPGFNSGQPHRDDIVRRVREALDLLWKDKAHAIEQEACEILGVKELRDYFRRPAGFFQEHLKRYSKSRRKAPIYWPLSTASGSYTIWLYYHRLSDQTLYAAVNKYVDPRIAEGERAIARIERELEAASGGEATRLGDRLNEARAFAGELHDFREELLRIAALPYRPSLNDGVIINAAPFHTLFRLRSWEKDTEKVWKKLEKGDYDWAHLAFTLWPERVKEVCRKDRSIAIAHGLEDLCEVPPPAAKGRGNSRERKKKEAER